MIDLFPDLPEAIENTQEITDKVEEYELDSDPLMPVFPIPPELGTEEEYRQKFSQEDLFNEFTRDEKGNVVLTEEEAPPVSVRAPRPSPGERSPPDRGASPSDSRSWPCLPPSFFLQCTTLFLIRKA